MNTPYFRLRAAQNDVGGGLSYELSAANERCSTTLEFRCDRDDFIQFAEELAAFTPRQEALYELAENNPKWAYYMLLRAFSDAPPGPCALEVQTSKLGAPPRSYRCQFSIVASPASLQELGRQVLALAQGTSSEVSWTPGAH